MKTSELTGALLDQWVARAEGKCATTNPKEWGNALINDFGRLSIAKGSWDCAKYFEPSKNWRHGGPIIEQQKMYVEWDADGFWVAHTVDSKTVQGPTLLIAAMRAYVAGKFGDEVGKDQGANK